MARASIKDRLAIQIGGSLEIVQYGIADLLDVTRAYVSEKRRDVS